MTVAPTTEPSGRNCWIMPTLRPMSTGLVSAGAAFAAASGAVGCSVAVVSSVTWPSLELDLDVDARRQVEPHERVDRLLGRVVDVDEPLVRTDLDLLARVLVDERAADDGELLDTRW